MSLDLNQLKSVILTENQPLPLLLDHIYVHTDELQQEKLLIDVVNILLANHKTRCQGLELVRALMQYCQSDILAENALRWANYCMVRHAGDPHREAKLHTLSKILENTCGLESLNKGFCTECLPITLKACLVNCNDEEKVASLKCLSQCMKRFPVWFGSHKLKIEPFLLNCLENTSETVVINAAVGFMYFLQAGSAGVNGMNYIDNFSYYFKKLCATVQILYNNFFRDFGETYPVKIDEEVFEFNESVNHSNKNFETTVANRIVNCLLFIKTMIKMPFSVEKRMFPEQLLDIVARGLSVHTCSETSISPDAFNRRRLLNQIQSSLFQLLRVFMRGYREDLTPFAFIVKKILLNTWKKTYSCRCFEIFFKAQAYKTLTTCLYINMNMTNIQEVIIPILLKNIYPKRKTVSLNEKMNPADSTRFKIKRNLDGHDKHLQKSCLYALEALKYLLTSFSTSMQKQLQDITAVLLNIIGELQINANVLPYNNIICQVKIYEILAYISKIETTKTLPSIHVMTSVLYKGSKSQNWKISQASSEGLDLLEKISHPVCTTLHIQDHPLKLQLGPDNFSNGNNYEIKNTHKSDDTLDRHKEILIEEKLGNSTYENVNTTQNRDILVDSEEGARKGITILSDIVLNSGCSKELVKDNTRQDDSAKITRDIGENKQEAMNGSPKRGTETTLDDISHNTDIPRPNNQDPTILETMFCAFHDIVQE